MVWAKRISWCKDKTCGGGDCSTCFGDGEWWDGPGDPEDGLDEQEWPDDKQYAWDPKADDLVSDF